MCPDERLAHPEIRASNAYHISFQFLLRDIILSIKFNVGKSYGIFATLLVYSVNALVQIFHKKS